MKFMASDKANVAGNGSVAISLSSDEALVLFEFLQRFVETDELTIAHQAEERLLWNLCGELERRLTVPFSSDCAEQLSLARERLRDPTD